MDSLYGLGSTYSNYNTDSASADSLKSKLSTTDYSQAADDELMDACKEFETYFVEQVVKAMKKMIPESEDSSATSYLEMFSDNITQEIASTITENTDLGLAQTLYEQMKRNYNIVTVDTTVAEQTTAAAQVASETEE